MKQKPTSFASLHVHVVSQVLHSRLRPIKEACSSLSTSLSGTVSTIRSPCSYLLYVQICSEGWKTVYCANSVLFSAFRAISEIFNENLPMLSRMKKGPVLVLLHLFRQFYARTRF